LRSKKKKKKSYAGLVELLQEGHGPFCNPSPRKLRVRLLSPGKLGLVASTMIVVAQSTADYIGQLMAT
jgi:hypothetical protein